MSNAMSGPGAGRHRCSRLAWTLALAGLLAFVPLHAHAQSPPSLTEIQLQLSASSEPHRERITAAATESLARYAEWLGPFPLRTLTIEERPWRGAAGDVAGRIALDVPPWTAAPVMDLEAQVAYGIAREYWRVAAHSGERRSALDGLSWYLHGRVIERIFNNRYFTNAYSTESVRFFGGAIPWALPTLRLTRWTAGLGRDTYLQRAAPSAGVPALGRRMPAGLDATSVRVALGFGALERYLGWPTLQGALSAMATQSAEGTYPSKGLGDVLSAAAGQDLSWFLTPLLDPSLALDYSVQSFSTAPSTEPCAGDTCYRTRVSVARLGPFAFTGTSHQAEGPFDAGDGLGLRVAFDDGQAVTTRWDGRAAQRTFEFESPAPAASVRLDPEGILLLDDSPLDHVRSATPRNNTPIRKWVARWMVWLQDAMLSYAMLM